MSTTGDPLLEPTEVSFAIAWHELGIAGSEGGTPRLQSELPVDDEPRVTSADLSCFDDERRLKGHGAVVSNMQRRRHGELPLQRYQPAKVSSNTSAIHPPWATPREPSRSRGH
jgi:hypothetical protein